MKHARGILQALACTLVLAGQGALAQGCLPSAADRAFEFAGLNPAIEQKLPLSKFKPGQVVEIDPSTMPATEARAYIKALHGLGARVSIYLVGGHCNKGADCDALRRAGVRLGSTGSWNWDKEEARILDITHKVVKERLARGIVDGFLLGANYIRIDNLHNPAGTEAPRTVGELRDIVDLAQEIEDQLRSDGSIAPDTVTGIVAHNNLVAWEVLVNAGGLRRPPAFLTSERTAQLEPGAVWAADARLKAGTLQPSEVAEIAAGRRIARKLDVPYSIVEFARSHDLAAPGRYYQLPSTYVQAAAILDGVSEVIVMPSEDQYVGRAQVYDGSGPRHLLGRPQVGRGQPCAKPSRPSAPG